MYCEVILNYGQDLRKLYTACINFLRVCRAFSESVYPMIRKAFPIFPMAVFLVYRLPVRYNQFEPFMPVAGNGAQDCPQDFRIYRGSGQVDFSAIEMKVLLWIEKFGSGPKGSVILAEKP